MEQGGVAITTVPAPSSSQSSMDHHQPSSAQTPSSAQSEVCDSLDLSILATTSSCLDSEKVGIGYLSGGTATASPARRLSAETESPAKIGHAPGLSVCLSVCLCVIYTFMCVCVTCRYVFFLSRTQALLSLLLPTSRCWLLQPVLLTVKKLLPVRQRRTLLWMT